MDYFLESIARTVSNEFWNTLNRHCLVFPNRRAGLYFLKHLSAGIEKPVWAPSIYTINELFRSYSSLQLAGNEILLFELYKVYRKLRSSPESFDDFYFWGDMLMNDFDDVDKYLVDASALFSNVNDIRNIEHQFGSLTDEQKTIIKRFWVNFDIEKPTNEKAGFTGIWVILSGLYTGFRNSLKNNNLAYEGMIFRDIAETAEEQLVNATSWDMVHFIGFNALNQCERRLMTLLKKAGKARFYWDYDNSYINGATYNSAGYFMRDNLKIFGNNMPSEWNYDTMLGKSAPVVMRRVIETSSDVAQVKLISGLISEIPGLTPENAYHTAVVLADENLLMPVLTSLPENMCDINITMGYPLRQTLVYTFVRHLMDLQRSAVTNNGVVVFDSGCVINILKHSLMGKIAPGENISLADELIKQNPARVQAARFSDSEKLSLIFRKCPDPVTLSGYIKDILSLIALNIDSKENIVQRNIRNEFIYRIVLSVNRLESIINNPEISFTTDTYIRILDRMLRTQSVPFSGEPLSGIQIMGILETRALDFKNLIILSVNEGVLPAVSSSSSFIPFSLREAFGLPSVNHQESIYAYHFYRLLQRAENVTFAYNSNSEGLRNGEMSRFLIQMSYDKILKPDFMNLSFEIRSHNTIGSVIGRTSEHIQKLDSLYLNHGAGKILSPSAINLWLNCRMKFYYRYVSGLKEPEKISGDIDPAMLGNILHEIMRSLYLDHCGKVLNTEISDRLLKNDELLQRSVNKAINDKFKSGEEGFVRGNELIVRDVLLTFIRRILKFDRTLNPLTILRLEDPVDFTLKISSDNNEFLVRTGGIADRIDVVKGITRIVDYKTGNVSEKLKSLNDLFADDRDKDHDGWLQTLIYCEAYLSGQKDNAVRPSIYKIKKMSGSTFSDQLRLKADRNSPEVFIDDYTKIRDEFVHGLKETIARIFNHGEPFIMTKDERMKCSYCPYRGLCLR